MSDNYEPDDYKPETYFTDFSIVPFGIAMLYSGFGVIDVWINITDGGNESSTLDGEVNGFFWWQQMFLIFLISTGLFLNAVYNLKMKWKSLEK